MLSCCTQAILIAFSFSSSSLSRFFLVDAHISGRNCGGTVLDADEDEDLLRGVRIEERSLSSNSLRKKRDLNLARIEFRRYILTQTSSLASCRPLASPAWGGVTPVSCPRPCWGSGRGRGWSGGCGGEWTSWKGIWAGPGGLNAAAIVRPRLWRA